MGLVEIDPETGEETFTPDPNMPGGGGDDPAFDLGGLLDGPGGLLHGDTVPGEDPGESLFPLDVPGQGGEFDPFDTESMPKPWLTDPNWTPDSEPMDENPPVFEEGEFVDLAESERQIIDL